MGLPILSERSDIANGRLEFGIRGGCEFHRQPRQYPERVRKLRFFQPHQYDPSITDARICCSSMWTGIRRMMRQGWLSTSPRWQPEGPLPHGLAESQPCRIILRIPVHIDEQQILACVIDGDVLVRLKEAQLAYPFGTDAAGGEIRTHRMRIPALHSRYRSFRTRWAIPQRGPQAPESGRR